MKVVQNNAEEMMNSPLVNRYTPISDNVATMSCLKKRLLVFMGLYDLIQSGNEDSNTIRVIFFNTMSYMDNILFHESNGFCGRSIHDVLAVRIDGVANV